MNKQLIKKIVEVFNDNYVEFDDDYDDKISLSYEDIVGIRIGNR